ncbi:hypothetical protein SFRURICE_002852 [Spodoptera frugiperda]|nr:hypothetical protein SFRURICE_002852 [Spodoptera frugiperda]
MDKKNKKKTVIKRKSDESGEGEKKQKIMVNRKNVQEEKEKVEVVNQVVEVPVEQGQQIVHTGQLVEGNFEQPVFVNMKGEPVQLGPNTVILYEQSGNPSNFAFGGMWTMDSSGRIVMAETIYDVKGEPEEEGANFVQSNTEVTTLVATGTGAVRWLNQKYDFVVRKLQLNYDAGVKLLHSPTGCIQCVYLTTPSMQLAFNAVPQFLCIETGISTLIGEDLTWLLDTFKSCNPAWRQVRCVVCDPTKCQQAARAAARLCSAAGHTTQPTTHTTQPTTQPALSPHGELAARCKTYALALLRGDHTLTQLQVLKRSIIGTGAGTLRLWELLSRPNGAIAKLDSWLEADNYTNILHKNTYVPSIKLERLVTKFQNLVRNPLQLDEFVSIFFNVANQLENDRRTFALSRLRVSTSLHHLYSSPGCLIPDRLILHILQRGQPARERQADLRAQQATARERQADLRAQQATGEYQLTPSLLFPWVSYTRPFSSIFFNVANQLENDRRTFALSRLRFVSIFFNVANQLENDRRTFALSRLRVSTMLHHLYSSPGCLIPDRLILHILQRGQPARERQKDLRAQQATARERQADLRAQQATGEYHVTPNLYFLPVVSYTRLTVFGPPSSLQRWQTQLENDRRTFALSQLQGEYLRYTHTLLFSWDTETLKQSPTDTITQYAYNLMSHQTKKHSSAAICKYGTSTQECSCLFSKVFRLPCRHILMLTTELKVKTHIPFEPRWTVQHCLFGCENLNSATTNNTGAGSFLEQVVVEAEDAPRQTMQQSAVHQVGGVRQQQYVLATAGQPATPVSQVIFCGGGVGGVSGVSNVGGGAPVITSVLSAGGAVLTPHHSLHH